MGGKRRKSYLSPYLPKISALGIFIHFPRAFSWIFTEHSSMDLPPPTLGSHCVVSSAHNHPLQHHNGVQSLKHPSRSKTSGHWVTTWSHRTGIGGAGTFRAHVQRGAPEATQLGINKKEGATSQACDSRGELGRPLVGAAGSGGPGGGVEMGSRCPPGAQREGMWGT